MALGSSFYDELDATAGDAAANSYATVAEADDYHDGMVSTHNSDWTGATTEIKEDSLMWATRLLDQWVTWKGTKADVTFTAGIKDQNLAWPRNDVLGPEGEAWAATVIPVWLKEATAELARGLIASDLTKEPTRGINMLKAGDLTIDFDTQQAKRTLIKPVLALIYPYGTVNEGTGVSMKIVRV